MTEIKEIHNLSLEWGAVLNLATRIADIEDKIGPWDDLTNMVASLLDSHKTSAPETLATRVYPFLFRLYFRLKGFSAPVPFNQVSRFSQLVPDEEHSQYSDKQDGFLISNYSYSTYEWALPLEVDRFIENNSLWVPCSKLTPAQIKRLDKQANEHRA